MVFFSGSTTALAATFSQFRVDVDVGFVYALLAPAGTRSFVNMNLRNEFTARLLVGLRLTRSVARVLGLLALCAVAAVAQSPRDDSADSSGAFSSAGGKWTTSRTEDRMTAARRVRFDLPAESVANSVDQARIVLYCTNGKLELADFRPNIKMRGPDWPGWWGRPQMRVTVRVDGTASRHDWNWVNGHFLTMDKGTTRELIGAHLFRVQFQTPDGPQIAEFSPGGLDLNLAKNACGLTPKKP